MDLSLQAVAQIFTPFPQPSGPWALQDMHLPMEMPHYIILKQTAVPDCACTAISLARCQITWQWKAWLGSGAWSAPVREHTLQLVLGTRAMAAAAPSCTVGGLPRCLSAALLCQQLPQESLSEEPCTTSSKSGLSRPWHCAHPWCVLWVEMAVLLLLCLSHSESHTPAEVRACSRACHQQLPPPVNLLHIFTPVPRGRALIRGRRLCWRCARLFGGRHFRLSKISFMERCAEPIPHFTRQTVNTLILVLGRGSSWLCYAYH